MGRKENRDARFFFSIQLKVQFSQSRTIVFRIMNHSKSMGVNLIMLFRTLVAICWAVDIVRELGGICFIRNCGKPSVDWMLAKLYML